jgi:hypothetical protein
VVASAGNTALLGNAAATDNRFIYPPTLTAAADSGSIYAGTLVGATVAPSSIELAPISPMLSADAGGCRASCTHGTARCMIVRRFRAIDPEVHAIDGTSGRAGAVDRGRCIVNRGLV